MKKVLAVLLTILILFGWYVTLFGIGSFAPIKDQIKLGLDLSGGVYVVMEAQTNATGDELKQLMTQTQAVIEKRVNQMGLSEPVVTIEGNNRIRVELPGAGKCGRCHQCNRENRSAAVCHGGQLRCFRR